MVAENLKVVITADVNRAITDLNKFKVATQQNTASIEKLKNGFLNWARGLGAAYLSFNALRNALRFGLEAAQVAADATQIGRALDSMAKESGTSANEIVAALKKASGGTIAELDLMKSASKAALFDLPLDQIDRLMEIARASATATGESVQYMFDSIVTGIARGSPMILDNLGLTLKIGDATEKYAESLGKSADALSAEEKKMATLNAVLEAGGKIIERVGDAAREFTDAERAQRYKAAMADLRKEVGTSLLPAYRELLQVSTEIVETFTEAARASRAFSNLRAGAATLEDQIIAINVQISQMYKTLATPGNLPGVNMDDWRKTVRENIDSLEKQRDALLRQQGAIQLVESMRSDAAKKAAEDARKQGAQAEALQVYLDKVNAAYAMTKEGQRDALIESIRYWEEQLITASKTAPQIQAILAYLRDELKTMEETGKKLVDMWEGLEEVERGLIDTNGQLGGSFFGLTGIVDGFVDSSREIRPLLEEEIIAYENLRDAIDSVGIAMERMASQKLQALELAKEKTEEYKDALEKAKETAREMVSVMSPFADAVGAAMTGSKDAADMFKDAMKGAVSKILEMIALEAFARGTLAAVPGPTFNPIAAGLYYAAGTAALVASGVVSALAEGGIVTRPTMALVGERGPEAVIPLNRAGGMGPTVNVYVQGSVLEEEGLARRISKTIQRAGRGY